MLNEENLYFWNTKTFHYEEIPYPTPTLSHNYELCS